MSVTLISVEQASYLDVALQTRGPDEPFPPCPVCGERPTEIRTWRDPLAWPGDRLGFVDCGHVIGLDMSTYDAWCAQAGTNPWVGMFEDHSHKQQLRRKGSSE